MLRCFLPRIIAYSSYLVRSHSQVLLSTTVHLWLPFENPLIWVGVHFSYRSRDQSNILRKRRVPGARGSGARQAARPAAPARYW